MHSDWGEAYTLKSCNFQELLAAESGRKEMLSLEDRWGRTPLLLATSNGNTEVIVFCDEDNVDTMSSTYNRWWVFSWRKVPQSGCVTDIGRLLSISVLGIWMVFLVFKVVCLVFGFVSMRIILWLWWCIQPREEVFPQIWALQGDKTVRAAHGEGGRQQQGGWCHRRSGLSQAPENVRRINCLGKNTILLLQAP